MTGAIVRSSDQTSDRLQWFYLDRIRACAISWLANTKVHEIVKHGNWTTISGKKKIKECWRARGTGFYSVVIILSN